MTWISVDVESDGPMPPKFSMVCFGAVVVEDRPTRTYYGTTRPISEIFDKEALAISGISREKHLTFMDPRESMKMFAHWVEHNSKGRPVMISDNPAYDFAWINYYMHMYVGYNPFGFSARRIGDLYCGLVKDTFAKWKHLRTAPHDHNPVNDALGNAQALLKMREMGLRIPK